MKRVVSSSVVAVAILMGNMNLSAKDTQLKLTHNQMVQKSIKGEAIRQNKIFDKTSKEISSALNDTFKALSALQYNKDKEAIKLLKHHKTQLARDILIPLKDEMDITTMYIPMDAYPTFIKTAIKQLEQKDTKGAITTLIDGFNTLVGQKVVIPTSLLMAQDLIEDASKLDKNKKDKATKMFLNGTFSYTFYSCCYNCCFI